MTTPERFTAIFPFERPDDPFLWSVLSGTRPSARGWAKRWQIMCRQKLVCTPRSRQDGKPWSERDPSLDVKGKTERLQ